jgi:hypothetical protein
MRPSCTLRSLLVVLAIGGASACDDTMNMDAELDDLARHQSELEADGITHSQEVMHAGDLLVIRPSEDGFWLRASSHLGEMEHRMQDMEAMCDMAGHRFASGSMGQTISRLRERLQLHHQRMSSLAELPALRAEEEALRDAMNGMMGEMRGQQNDVRGTASRYHCRMHRH